MEEIKYDKNELCSTGLVRYQISSMAERTGSRWESWISLIVIIEAHQCYFTFVPDVLIYIRAGNIILF